MGDDDELCSVGELAERLREAADVAFVQCRVHLVEHAEGRGSHAQDREEQGSGGEGSFTAGELREAADAFAGWARVDVDAWLLGIIARAERRLAAVEKALEEDAELAVDSLQGGAELLCDRPRQIVRECSQVGHGALEVGLLRRKELVALTDLGELRGGERVHRLEGDEPPPEALEGGDRARLLLFIRLVVERDARRVRERLVFG